MKLSKTSKQLTDCKEVWTTGLEIVCKNTMLYRYFSHGIHMYLFSLFKQDVQVIAAIHQPAKSIDGNGTSVHTMANVGTDLPPLTLRRGKTTVCV